MVIYMDNSLEDIAKRSGFGEEAYENTPFQAKVKKVYEEQLITENWWRVNGMRDIEEIAEEILGGVSTMLHERFGVDNPDCVCPPIKKLFID